MDSSKPTTMHEPAADTNSAAEAAHERLSDLSCLLQHLEQGEADDTEDRDSANQLVQVRLGMASSLFTALRAKHAPTAAHCLRVAMGVSSWGLSRDLQRAFLDQLEVAGLLHDIGKIGVPDRVLLKPGKLSREEQAAVERHRHVGNQILLSCCASQEILNIVKYAPAWFDGSKQGFDRSGTDLPWGSRLVAIIDAFDAMTTDHVYRRAMPRDRAIAELFAHAGSQFDPELVREFTDLLSREQVHLDYRMARRWLEDLRPEDSNQLWRLLTSDSVGKSAQTIDQVFHQKLLDSMQDGVIFVDSNLQVMLFNRAAERMTGLAGSSVLQRHWSPSIVDLRDESQSPILDEECPLADALRAGTQSLRRLTLQGRGGEPLQVDAHMVPVIGRDGVTYGATLLLHDASSQVTLEERVQMLHERATRDPLTQVANRAEFDRVHAQFIEKHLERGLPCSLIICDLDHFKNINDTFGHQAGDEALVAFSALLRRSCRPGDLVARYGGEEFVLLCADCDNASATQRAENIRLELAGIEQTMLGGRRITASFGVTEIQPGDTPETMLRRADRALLHAKDSGRNLVVQLGSGIGGDEKSFNSRGGWMGWFQRTLPDQLLSQRLVTAVPLSVVAEKLKGFVADHHAEIVSFEEDRIAIKVEGQNVPTLRRGSDRTFTFFIGLAFTPVSAAEAAQAKLPAHGTCIDVTIRPRRTRDRRRNDCVERARQILLSLRSYLMAQEIAR